MLPPERRGQPNNLLNLGVIMANRTDNRGKDDAPTDPDTHSAMIRDASNSLPRTLSISLGDHRASLP